MGAINPDGEMRRLRLRGVKRPRACGQGREAALVTAPLDSRRAPGSGLHPGGDGARSFFLRLPGAPRRESGPLGRRLRPSDAWLLGSWAPRLLGRHPGQGRAPPMIPPHPRAVSLHTPEGSPTPRTQAASLQDKEKDEGTSGQNFISISRSL